MRRLAALLAFLISALSLITTASAYKIAQPTSPVTVTLANFNAAQIRISAGSGDSLGWVQGAGSGAVTIDMTHGPGTATGYWLDDNATYTLYKVVRVTNMTNVSKNISLTPSTNYGSFGTITGYINGGGASVAGPWSVAGSGGFVEVNLPFTTGSSGATYNISYTVTAN